ncbi:hypothetical protein KJ632_03310 [Patescibacteria group bacterium]|nr:hypothetical protein [Patescibacteria group bacterium]
MTKEILSKKSAEKKNLENLNTMDEGSADSSEAISKTSADVMSGADLGLESSEKVSEVSTEGREKKSDSAKTDGARGKKFDPAVVRAQLLKKMPTVEKMRDQVEAEIKHEIKYLRKKAFRMIRAPHKVSFFELANIVRKIRTLRALLLELVKASFDRLKTLWLRFVHGIM